MTNTSSMQALRVLQGLDRDVAATQTAIATGLKVSNARDNAAIWKVSTALRSDVSTLRVVNDGISRAQAELATIDSAFNQVTELLDRARAKSALLERPDNVRARALISSDIKDLMDQAEGILADTSFNGATLLNGTERRVIIGADGETLTMGGTEVTAQTLGLDAVKAKADIVAPQVTAPPDPNENPDNGRATFGNDALSVGAGRTGPGGSDGINGAIAATGAVNVLDGASDFVKMLAYGTRWGAAGSAGPELTYSLHNGASTYKAGYGNGESASAADLSTAYEGAIRDIMAYASGITGITFTEVTETATLAGDMRFAQWNDPSPDPDTAHAYLPGDYAEAGDMWISSYVTTNYATPSAGTYANLTIIHELGHALGLKHPHEENIDGEYNYDGADIDHLKYSVMSYKDFAGDTNDGYGATYFPTSFMVGDIAALQAIYGAGGGNGGDTTYSWTGDAFETLWDSGGTDTIDLSNKTAALDIDLTPGTYSDIGTTVTFEGTVTENETLGIAYGTYIENVVGGSGNDTIKGNDVDNVFTGGAGNDTMDGGAGINVAVFSGNADQYTIADQGDGTVKITGADGVDTLSNIQVLRFDDGDVDVSALMPPITAEEAAAADNPGDYSISLELGLQEMIDVAMQRTVDAATDYANTATRLDSVLSMNETLMQNLMEGIGVLVDTDMVEASARSQALQVQQQLAQQSLSIANGNARSILQLFG
ncbi:flagellin N-terminal helical domain-containing protein [Caenispirillum salinarum]|uniref:flagellin N-terminal helical domain-containing protein n=1 Tax=Caenispirillum salinarum TaxID=859058 RepID=UPI0012675FDB|nr:M10 family metallopeptidase C-terminal domain-containing protein [Caenispirillum salinarum]